MMHYNISKIKMYPEGDGTDRIPLEINEVYKELINIKQELECVRNKMEPYYQHYGSLFKSVTSNFGSFKNTRFHISCRFNTPSVSNLWINMYELISGFNLVPSNIDPTSDNEWIHFSSENLPGSTILAMHHYVNTMRNDDFCFKYNWFGSTSNRRNYRGEDIYNLFHNYKSNWVTESSSNTAQRFGCNTVFSSNRFGTKKKEHRSRTPKQSDSSESKLTDDTKQFTSNRFNFDKTSKEEEPIKPSNEISLANGDVRYPSYTHYVVKWLKERISSPHKINMFTAIMSIEINKKYNLEEPLHNKLFLGQIFLCLNILDNGGNAIFRNLTYFTRFNISMIAWVRNYFDEFSIVRPMSSKNDSSEVFLICKGFQGISKKDINYIEKILNDNTCDYDTYEIIRLDKITKSFWYDLQNSYQIFKDQIQNIKSNIDNFNRLLRCNSTRESGQTNIINQSKMLKDSQKIFIVNAERESGRWGTLFPMRPLDQRKWLKITNTTKKKYTRKTRGYPS